MPAVRDQVLRLALHPPRDEVTDRDGLHDRHLLGFRVAGVLGGPLTSLRVTGRANGCPSVNVATSVTAPAQAIAVDLTGGFDVTLALNTAVNCGDNVAPVVAECSDHACSTALLRLDLPADRLFPRRRRDRDRGVLAGVPELLGQRAGHPHRIRRARARAHVDLPAEARCRRAARTRPAPASAMSSSTRPRPWACRHARNATNAPSGSTTCFPGAALTCDAARHRRSWR